MIKKGDLVMVVKPSPCCGNTSAIGRVFRVLEERISGKGMCIHCYSISTGDRALIGDINRYVLFTRLIKIDPPEDSAAMERESEMVAH